MVFADSFPVVVRLEGAPGREHTSRLRERATAFQFECGADGEVAQSAMNTATKARAHAETVPPQARRRKGGRAVC
jgi:hypothetical protein